MFFKIDLLRRSAYEFFNRLAAWTFLESAFATGLIIALAIMLFAFPISGATFESNENEGYVYYFGFEVERITGIPEHQIEQYGCLYEISKQKFASLLTKASSMIVKYDQRDIRAKVVFKDEEPYFVNRTGVVRHGSDFFIINKNDFVTNLSIIKQGRCR